MHVLPMQCCLRRRRRLWQHEAHESKTARLLRGWVERRVHFYDLAKFGELGLQFRLAAAKSHVRDVQARARVVAVVAVVVGGGRRGILRRRRWVAQRLGVLFVVRLVRIGERGSLLHLLQIVQVGKLRVHGRLFRILLHLLVGGSVQLEVVLCTRGLQPAAFFVHQLKKTLAPRRGDLWSVVDLGLLRCPRKFRLWRRGRLGLL
mmetsp:Transcript_5780/g.18334  ORF Transcript_5780/g.18334 Transcript_5780/m.18334 type:complete len:204 (+) Transcript_5780:1339-1950(+)